MNGLYILFNNLEADFVACFEAIDIITGLGIIDSIVRH